MNMQSGEQPPAAAEAEAAEVRVLGSWASPFVMRVMVALRLKGVEYELVQETMGKKSELLLASNPVHKKIPVLLHRGRPISESLIIVQYVDEVWPPASGGAPAIIPRDDPYAAAIHRFWGQYIDDMVQSSCLAGDELSDDAAAAGDEGIRDVDALLGGGVRGLVMSDDAHPLVTTRRGLHGGGWAVLDCLPQHEVLRRLHRRRVPRRGGVSSTPLFTHARLKLAYEL